MSLQRGAIAFIVDLTSKPELNGIRVRLKEFIEDRQRWRVYRVDSLSAEPLGVKADNLVVESPGKLPPLLSSASATADKQNLVLAWLNSGGDIDAISRGSPKETGANLLMAACERGDADFAAELLRITGYHTSRNFHTWFKHFDPSTCMRKSSVLSLFQPGSSWARVA